MKPNLLVVKLPVREAKNGMIEMLYDSGSTISLIKLNQLKDETLIYDEKIALTGITGHKIHTLGKAYVTIKLDGHRIKHAFYIVKDDMPIEHEGILGIDFLRKHSVSCNYQRAQIKIGKTTLDLYASAKIKLKPRSETIIKASTRKNRIGTVQAEEIIPGVYIGNCLVESKNFSCPVSIMNTTDKEVDIRTPQVKIEKTAI